MPDYSIIAQANSLFVKKGELGTIKQSFFYADFEKKEITKLIEDKINQDGSISKSAGICIIVNEPYTLNEKVYAFRVEWRSRDLFRSADLPEEIITSAEITDIPPVEGGNPILPTTADGDIIWRQPKTQEYNVEDEPVFVFVDAFTLARLISFKGCKKIRIRKAAIRTKIKKNNSNSVRDKYFYLNYIVESVPTFSEKTDPDAPILGVVNTITDEDVVAQSYGIPCPPFWIPASSPQGLISGYGIAQRSQILYIGNNIAIKMGTIIDAIQKNVKVRELMTNCEIIDKPKILNVFGDGLRVVLEDPEPITK
jgi:hypothetical protein